MFEIWRDIVGYEDWYQVSNLGRVRSVDRVVVYKTGQKRIYKGQILKQQNATNGYKIVDLQKNKNRKHFLVHRLVGKAFLPNLLNLPEINHLDEDKTNNSLENLAWCTVLENRIFGTRTKRATENKDYTAIGKKNKLHFGKRVRQMSKDGSVIAEFISLRDIERICGYHRQHISACCNGKYKLAYGYAWKFAD